MPLAQRNLRAQDFKDFCWHSELTILLYLHQFPVPGICHGRLRGSVFNSFKLNITSTGYECNDAIHRTAAMAQSSFTLRIQVCTIVHINMLTIIIYNHIKLKCYQIVVCAHWKTVNLLFSTYELLANTELQYTVSHSANIAPYPHGNIMHIRLKCIQYKGNKVEDVITHGASRSILYSLLFNLLGHFVYILQLSLACSQLRVHMKFSHHYVL